MTTRSYVSRFGRLGLYLAILGALTFVSPALGDVKLPSIIGDNMVLQQECRLKIWGWAEAGEKVKVTMGKMTAETAADKDGKWTVTLPAMPAGGPHTITISGKNTIELKNVMVGEVWLGSGQSNMAMGVNGVKNAKQEIAAADYPNIRLFLVSRRPFLKPLDNVGGQWVVCSPNTVKGFSAVMYFFGRELHKELKLPVGLIASAWGGTLIEPWLPLAALESEDKLANLAQRAKKPAQVNQRSIHQHPTALYNGMINGLVGYAMRGVLWYQGESNVMSNDQNYLIKQRALIEGWRKAWGQGDFPFLYVQLAPWNRYKVGWLPLIWEAQLKCLSIPNTGMAVTTDITGNVGNIHPPNKQDVGKRLALWALAKTYGRSGIVYSGPLYKSVEIKGNEIHISFDHVGGGLMARDGEPLTHFAIAGQDKKFLPAKARIEGDKVVVSSEQVAKPLAVRFAWDKTAMPNLCNKEGLPASPFRTDQW